MITKDIPELEEFPLPLSNPVDISSVFCYTNVAVSVNYYIYDPRRKTIIKFGSSKPCGKNNRRSSIHAEQIAINYCLKHDKRKKYIIIISKFTKDGKHKKKTSCVSCSQLIKKYNFQNRIFTVDEMGGIIPALITKPEMCLAYKIKEYRIKYNL